MCVRNAALSSDKLQLPNGGLFLAKWAPHVAGDRKIQDKQKYGGNFGILRRIG
jgi:hypothetical protein